MVCNGLRCPAAGVDDEKDVLRTAAGTTDFCKHETNEQQKAALQKFLHDSDGDYARPARRFVCQRSSQAAMTITEPTIIWL
jgi:hypothetical protein